MPNRLLDRLEAHEPMLLQQAEEVRLSVADRIVRQDDILTHAYFPVDSVLSVIVVTSEGLTTEVSATSNLGMVGLELIAGGASHGDVVCQAPGLTIRLPADIIRSAWRQNAEVRDDLFKYAVALLGNYAQSAACNRLHSVEERCGRWLLTMSDGKDANSFDLTHEFLAAMLGANRTTVSLTLRTLEHAGLIRRSRTRIEIEDREGLKETSCECYGIINRHYLNAFR